jgi:hypothetical protein
LGGICSVDDAEENSPKKWRNDLSVIVMTIICNAANRAMLNTTQWCTDARIRKY